MKRIALIAAAFVVALAGCAAQPAKNLDAPVLVNTSTTGASFIDGKALNKPSIKVEFKDSQKLSALIEQELAAKGFAPAPDGAMADIHISIESGYAFQKPRTRRQVLSMGKLFEHESMKAYLDDRAEKSTRTTSFNVHTTGMAATGALSTGVFVGASVTQAIVEMTGIRGGFNKALVGDERGLCLGTCDKWHIYDQRLILKATLTEASGRTVDITATSTVEHERLVPIELYEDARSKLLTALAGL